MSHLRIWRILLVPLALVAATLPTTPTSPASSAPPVPSAPVVIVRPDVVYGSSVTVAGVPEDLSLDLFLPGADDVPHAAVVLAHGGGFRRYTRKQPLIRLLARALAEQGYVVASIDYRLRPRGTPVGATDVRFPLESLATQPRAVRDAQHDFQAAVRYLRRHVTSLHIDPGRIVAMGASSGAITALEAAFNPEDPGESGSPGYLSDVAAVVSLWGASHVSRIEPGAPPALMFHGTDDATIPFALGLETCAGTTSQGNRCEGRWWPGVGHPGWEHMDEITSTTLEFLDRHLG